MPELRLVPSRIAPRRTDDAFAIGRRYCLAEGASLDEARRLCADQDIVVGGYRIERTRADIIPADPHQPDRLFIWNSDAKQEPLRGVLRNAEAKAPQSSLLLANAGLEGPVLLTSETQHRLSLTAVFELEWRSHTDAARLAAVELVQSTRNIRFEDGRELCLLDTGKVQGPVRYAQGDDTPLKPITGQQGKEPGSHHRYQVRIGQHIPERLHGKAVADVTVLEKYTSHFLMCEDPRDVENHMGTSKNSIKARGQGGNARKSAVYT
jgi:hypothetical protein